MKGISLIIQRIKEIWTEQVEKTSSVNSLDSGTLRLSSGLFLLTWVCALSLPFEVWPYIVLLPVVFFQGISRMAFAWCLIILWVWLGIPSASGRGFALLKAVLPVVAGSASGRFIHGQRFRMMTVLLVTMIPFCLLSILQWIYHVPVPQVWFSGDERWILPTRVTAVYRNPNLYGEILLFLLPIGLSGTLKTNRCMLRSFAWCWVAAAFSGLVLTFSYGVWIATFFELSVFAALCFAKRPRLTVLIIASVAVGAFAFAGVWHGSTAVYRWNLWREAWLITIKHPWGVGPDGLREWLAVSGAPSSHVHNLFLQTAAETGLFGVVILFFILRSVILQITQSVDLNRAAVIASLCGLLLYGMVDYPWATPLVTGLFWMGLEMLGEPV